MFFVLYNHRKQIIGSVVVYKLEHLAQLQKNYGYELIIDFNDHSITIYDGYIE